MTTTNKSYKTAFIFLTSLFFLWGFITVLVDSLIPRLKEVFTLSYFQAGLVQFAFFGAYFLLSIPAGNILAKIGYKRGIVLGLVTMALGCLLFYPAASYRIFGIFMLAYFVLAGGMTILQVAANPYVAVLGSEEGASSRLNLSQAFNSLGTTIAPAIGAMLILSDKVKTKEEIASLASAEKEAYFVSEASAVQSPFLNIAFFVILLAVIFIFVKLPKVMEKIPNKGYKALMSKKSLVMGAIAIFVYVGAEVAIGSYLVSYFMEMNLAPLISSNETMMSIANTIATLFNKTFTNSDPKSLLGVFVVFYWGGAMIGRFVGAYLTKILSPVKVLGLFASLAILMIIISVSTTGLMSMWAILAVGLFNSIMFPTIFSLSLEGLDDLKPQASGILCTAIFGGAVIPPLYGMLVDGLGFKLAFVLIMMCYIYIYYYGRTKSKTSQLEEI